MRKFIEKRRLSASAHRSLRSRAIKIQKGPPATSMEWLPFFLIREIERSTDEIQYTLSHTRSILRQDAEFTTSFTRQPKDTIKNKKKPRLSFSMKSSKRTTKLT
jgi:hypothetical protein